ncbi:MAG TPA: hypothetical protein VEL76_13945 [Gemmataceae bacterium]|nr:hypothetical protein [Gemmataceae bacterium]
MQQFFRCAGLLVLGLALIVPSFAAQEKKDDKPAVGDGKTDKTEPAKKDDKKDKDEPPKEKLVYGVHFTGKLTQLAPEGQKDFTVQVVRKVPELNQGSVNRLQDLQRQLVQQQQAYAAARNLQQRQQAVQKVQEIQGQMAQAQREMYKYKDVTDDHKLRAAENIKVRSYTPPLDYDEKGNVKKYTAEELKALRGTEGLPGFTIEWDAVRTGQIVHVYLARPAAPIKGNDKKGKKIDEIDEATTIQARPTVVMIMILQEPQAK